MCYELKTTQKYDTTTQSFCVVAKKFEIFLKKLFAQIRETIKECGYRRNFCPTIWVRLSQ